MTETVTPPETLRGDTRDDSRRDFLRTAVGTGFAAAVLPVVAQTEVRTDSVGLDVGEVMIDVAGFQLPAYRAAPSGKTGLPVILVVSEIFGVHEHIADVARRFAKLGYLAIAPELFVRQGDPSSYGEIDKLMAEIIRLTPDAQVLADLDACVAWAGRQGGDTRRLGITGFCWGGRITWLYAAHNPAVKAGVAWYGRLTGPVTPQNPRHPVDLAGELKAPVLGLYGGQDGGIPLSAVEQMKAALAAGSTRSAAAQASRFVVYPDAPHAFHADYRPSYRQADAQDGWRRCLDWLASHGAA
ncbi:dienelactone hydrolase family protein [Leptothrix discophora]|uniref:Dienelactone hydrolase family protein n=1 Tax=Leptothrix discophora TaxID=89 RepID=A0ABT9G464_LEPDI|nr:dienelactone hydrolase family protein [Leptothrix discophora]MDP4301280.1 dienelactone hydrolase family protein [Leptothrix discophora]